MHKIDDTKLIHSLKSFSHVDKKHYIDILELIHRYNDLKIENTKMQNKVTHLKNELKKTQQPKTIQEQNKEKMLEQQSRLAAMGEMIDSIAHQWKQPLNAISMIADMLKVDYEANGLNDSYIDELNETIHLQIEHMVGTLSEFRDFLRPSTKNEKFTFKDVFEKVQILMKDELISQNLHISFNIDETLMIYGNQNEFKHLFINLVNNSIDAFNEKHVEKRELHVCCYKKDDYIVIEFKDNAGGIDERVIDTLFDAHITTKAIGKGTGIGLYMSKKIVEKNNGSISAKNANGGAFFTITLPIFLT